MESNWPKWLDNDVISKALDGLKQIQKVLITPAVPYGDNYLSTILRADVEYKNMLDQSNHTSLILKTFPPGSLATFVDDNGILKKEVTMYKCVLPLVSDILGKYITPKCLESGNENVLILEDLSLDGYKFCDRVEGMDLKHSLFAVKRLADFHGATYILNNNSPNSLDYVKQEVHYTEKNQLQKQFIYINFKYLSEELKNWPGYEKHSTKLDNITEMIWNKTINEILPQENDISVLNHGDFWTNNILFQYDEHNEIIDAKLIDFQFSRWTSPAIDLQNFFTICVRNKKHLPLLIDTYLSRLNQHIHPQQMSKQQLMDALDRTECFSLLLTVSILPMLLISPLKAKEIGEKFKDFDSAYDNPVCRYACKEPEFKKVFKESLHHFERIGLI